MALVSVELDIHTSLQEHQQEKQMADVRRDITSEFQKIAKDLENQLKIQLQEFEKQVYGEIEQQIISARYQEESAIADSNIGVKKLLEIRKDFELILSDITKVAENSVV